MTPYDTEQYAAIKSFWQELDTFDGEMNGFKVAARRNFSKAWCGYVQIPQGHPFHGKDCSDRVPVPDRDALVVEKSSPLELFCEAIREDDGTVSLSLLLSPHGGVTYASTGWPVDDGEWWIGFDCSHYNDLTPQQVFNSTCGGIWELQSGPDAPVYRSLEYVENELEQLTAKFKEHS